MLRSSNQRPPRILLLLLLCATLLPALVTYAAPPAFADGVVGQPEPGSCPDAADADAYAQGDGGGGGGSTDGDPDDPLDRPEPLIVRVIETVVLLPAMMGL